MGARANYVVVDDDGWRLRYSHWGAQRIDVDLAAGPGPAVRFIDRQQVQDRQTGWLNDRWAEGAALVDLTCRRLVFFGAAEHLPDLDYRRAYVALLRRTWPARPTTRSRTAGGPC